MGHHPPADSATGEVTFEAVAAAHYPSLLQRLMFIVRDHAEAEDLAQATLLRSGPTPVPSGCGPAAA